MVDAVALPDIFVILAGALTLAASAAGIAYTVSKIKKSNAETRILELDLVRRQRELSADISAPPVERQIAIASLKLDYLYSTFLQIVWFGASLLIWTGTLGILQKVAIALLVATPEIELIKVDPGSKFQLDAIYPYSPIIPVEALVWYLVWHSVIEQIGTSLLSLSFGVPILLSIRRYLSQQTEIAKQNPTTV